MMELSSAQHQQETAADSLENMLICAKAAQQERKPRPQQEQALRCPRCDSTNTKFFYYNNYSLTQPRYFCKSCRRYWTSGGTLRNVPVGGGFRKNKRPSSKRSAASSSSDTANSNTHHQPQPHFLSSNSDTQNQLMSAFSSRMSSQMSSYDDSNYHHRQSCSDLSRLVFDRLQKQASGYDYNNQNNFANIMGLTNNSNLSSYGQHGSFLEGLKDNLLEQTQQLQNSNVTSSTIFMYNGFGGCCTNNSASVSDQIMIPYEDLSSSCCFGSKAEAGLKQEDQQLHLHQLNDNNDVNSRSSSQLLMWGAAGAAGLPWHQINHHSSIGGGHGHGDSNSSSSIMVDRNADLVRDSINVFAAAAPVWHHGLLNTLLL